MKTFHKIGEFEAVCESGLVLYLTKEGSKKKYYPYRWKKTLKDFEKSEKHYSLGSLRNGIYSGKIKIM